MIAYHGTTMRRAQRICEQGFLPKKPSRRVWFAETHAYALGRTKTQARRTHDRPVVLTCEINTGQFRGQLGSRRVFHKNGVIAIDGAVPVNVLRSFPAVVDQPSSPEDLATWTNEVLGLKSYKGVSPKDPGILRLAQWVANRYGHQPGCQINPTELLHLAKQWLPTWFGDAEVDLERLRVLRRVKTIQVEVDPDELEGAEKLEEALGLLDDPKPERRAKGLAILEEIQDTDLFDWCVMCLDDESRDVKVAALRAMRQCEEGNPEPILPFTRSDDKLIRAVAVAALGRHAGESVDYWLKRGLKDPEPCVRVETATLLPQLDPVEHREVFELALYDPNPDIAKRAQDLTTGKGYSKLKW